MEQEKDQLQEQHAKEIEEVTETGMAEISELEAKIDEEHEKNEALQVELE